MTNSRRFYVLNMRTYEKEGLVKGYKSLRAACEYAHSHLTDEGLYLLSVNDWNLETTLHGESFQDFYKREVNALKEISR